MSKSMGNFILLNESIKGHRLITINEVTKPVGWTADATRVALADGGDGLEDANFSMDVADTAIMRLFNEIGFAEEIMSLSEPATQSSAHQLHARIFEARLDNAITEADSAYSSMRFRDALVASFFGLQESRDAYRKACSLLKEEPTAKLLRRYVELLAVLLSPICPHFCDHVWRNILVKPGSVMNASWPAPTGADATMLRVGEYLSVVESRVRSTVDKQMVKKKQAVKKVSLHVAADVPPLHKRVIELLRSLPRGPDLLTRVSAQLKDVVTVKSDMKEAMRVAATVHAAFETEGEKAFETTLPFDEIQVLRVCAPMLAQSLGLEVLEVSGEKPPGSAAADAVPGKPLIVMA